MATEGDGDNWWGSWMNAAKAKSAEVYDFVKRDFDELSTVVKSEVNAVATSTSNVVRETLQLDNPESTANTMKRSMSSFLDQVGTALSPPPDDGDEEAIMIQGDNPVYLSRLQSRIYSLATDPRTFTEEIPNEQLPQFEAWLSVFEEDKISPEKLSRMLAANSALQQNYESLVPQHVSHAVFWQRFLFHKGLIEDEEAARERKEERDKQTVSTIQWEKEESLSEHIELTEEEQIKILEDYERERKEKELMKEDKGVVERNSPSLIEKEKKDMVIICNSTTGSVSTGSTGDKESNDDDWEQDFEIDVSDNTTIIENEKLIKSQ
uniref:BSD domain-containing protein n=1 Tax=Clastoptera arizonana TaxID=38151 RepID=A0A1B6EDN0_9HEMI